MILPDWPAPLMRVMLLVTVISAAALAEAGLNHFVIKTRRASGDRPTRIFFLSLLFGFVAVILEADWR